MELFTDFPVGAPARREKPRQNFHKIRLPESIIYSDKFPSLYSGVVGRPMTPSIPADHSRLTALPRNKIGNKKAGIAGFSGRILWLDYKT
jgi:hypothetical protein